MRDQTPAALVEVWRELAKDGTWADSAATRSWAAGLNRCANDLEAALALSREAQNDREMLASICDLLTAEKTEGLNWPGVARLIRRAALASPSPAPAEPQQP